MHQPIGGCSASWMRQSGRLDIIEPAAPNHRAGNPSIKDFKMNKLLLALAVVFATGAASAQTGTSVKETGKAVAETAKAATETAEGAVTTGPKKAKHQAKAKAHLDKAHEADEKAKAAGDKIGK